MSNVKVLIICSFMTAVVISNLFSIYHSCVAQQTSYYYLMNMNLKNQKGDFVYDR